jgi:hypothetical protein
VREVKFEMRMVYVAYGDVSRVQLKASAKPLDALLQTGFDLYVEVAPKQWMRAVDLPHGHPALTNLSAGSYKAGLTDASGQTFTILNAYNPEHKKLAAQEGLYIDVPYTEQKHEEVEQAIQKILGALEVAVEFEELKVLVDQLKKLEKTEEPEEKQRSWDTVVNDTLTLTDALEKVASLMPSNYEKLNLQEAIKKAKREVALEESIESSILTNPRLWKDLRQKLLEEA